MRHIFDGIRVFDIDNALKSATLQHHIHILSKRRPEIIMDAQVVDDEESVFEVIARDFKREPEFRLEDTIVTQDWMTMDGRARRRARRHLERRG